MLDQYITDDSQQFNSEEENTMDYELITAEKTVSNSNCPVLKDLKRRFDLYLTKENKSGEVYRITNNEDCQLYMLKIDNLG